MKFTTPCFVRVEDAEKRKELTEWLKGIGYYVCSCCLFGGCNTLHCCGIDRLKIAYEVHGICDYDEETRYSIDQFKAEIAESCYPSYDCGTNIALFKALAAMNDENDYMQLFINKSNRYRWVFCNAQRLFDAVAKECDWRKATAAEIVEHFKK
jgi:hypothetical protein